MRQKNSTAKKKILGLDEIRRMFPAQRPNREREKELGNRGPVQGGVGVSQEHIYSRFAALRQ